jgi:hypothetical protein
MLLVMGIRQAGRGGRREPGQSPEQSTGSKSGDASEARGGSSYRSLRVRARFHRGGNLPEVLATYMAWLGPQDIDIHGLGLERWVHAELL